MSTRPSRSPEDRRTTLENGLVVVEARWRDQALASMTTGRAPSAARPSPHTVPLRSAVRNT